MKFALRVIFFIIAAVFAFLSLMIPGAFSQVQKNKMLLADMKDVVTAINSFKEKVGRLPTDDELSKIEDSLPRRYSLRYDFNFGPPPSQPGEDYPEKALNGGWIIWYWRGEWSEFYSSWDNHYSLEDQVSPSSFYGPFIWAPVASVIFLGLAFLPALKRPNKTLQLTPSRLALLSHDRFSFPSTSLQSLVARSG